MGLTISQKVGIDLVTVAETLGHADIKMIMQYAHPTPENKRKAVNVLAAVFSHKEEEEISLESHERYDYLNSSN